MNEVRLGSTRIARVTTTEGKKMLAAYRADNTRLLMDIMSYAIEDGQTGYMFDNKLIIVVHWKDFSEEDKAQTAASDIRLRFCAVENGFWCYVKFGNYDWGDVITLPGLISGFNSADRAVTDIVFFFVDSATGEPIAMRTMPLTAKAGSMLSQKNGKAYSWFSRSGYKALSYTRVSELFNDWLTASSHITEAMVSASPLSKTAFLALLLAQDDSVAEEFETL